MKKAYLILKMMLVLVLLFPGFVNAQDCEFFYDFTGAQVDSTNGIPLVAGDVKARCYVSSVTANDISFPIIDENTVAEYPSVNTMYDDVCFIQTDTLAMSSFDSDVTLGMWVKLKNPKLDSPGDARPLQILMSAIGSRALLQMRAAGDKWGLETAVNTSPGYFATSASLDYGMWYHIALVTKVATPTIEVYLNGELLTLTAKGNAVLEGFGAFNKVRIGAHNNLTSVPGPMQTFCGQMDEVFMYSKALSKTQIDSIMGSAPGQNDVDPGPVEVVKASYFYDFTDATIADGVPTVGGTTDAVCTTVENSPYNISFIDDEDRGMVLNYPVGNNKLDSLSYIQTSGLTSGSYNSDATYAMWVKSNSLDGRPMQVLLTGVNGKSMMGLRPMADANAGKFQLETSCDATAGLNFAASSHPLSPGEWVHLALVTTLADSSITLFINGQVVEKDTVNTHSGIMKASGFQPFSELRIGVHSNVTGGFGQSFSGQLDDIFMCSQAFTEAQIDSVMKSTSTETSLGQTSAKALSIYPCPVKQGDNLYITTPVTASVSIVNIYDLTGRAVYASEHSGATFTLPCQLSKGQYIVSLRSGEQIFTKKLLVN